MYVIAVSRGLADPYYVKNELSKTEERIYREKGEAYGNVYVQIGEKCAVDLEKEVEEEISKILSRCGIPKTYFSFVAASLLGYNYLDFQITAKSEHANRLKVINVERDFINLRIYKGTKKKEYCEIWEAIEDYLTHNVPVGLVRVEDEGSKLYNEKINGVKTSVIQKEYHEAHPSSLETTTQRNAIKLINKRSKYKTIKTQ